jgi:hypothetical protein
MATDNIPGNISLADYMKKWQETVNSINEIKTMLGSGHSCKQEGIIGEFKQVVKVQIPEMKKSIDELDKKFDDMNDSVVIIKDKVLNGSLGIKAWKIWSAIGGIILTFGTIIIWILGQIK